MITSMRRCNCLFVHSSLSLYVLFIFIAYVSFLTPPTAPSSSHLFLFSFSFFTLPYLILLIFL